ncbi:MAG: hypothetical protein H7836_09320, partial [Magnetococcus sp. YQC-3]
MKNSCGGPGAVTAPGGVWGRAPRFAMVFPVVDINWLEEQWLLWAVILLLLCAVYGLLRRRRRLLARAEELSVGSRRRAQPVVVVPVAEVESTPLPIQVDDSRLPDQEPWVGRQKQFSLLDGWLADPEVGVVALLAPDGGGKS